MMQKYLNYTLVIGIIFGTQILLVIGVFTFITSTNSTHIDFKTNFLNTFFKKPLTISGSKEEQFMQAQSNTCGPAALAYLLNVYGLMLSEDEIIKHVELSDRGTRLYDLINVAEYYGFKSWGEKQNFKGLLKTKLPVLVHINNRHYVVVDHIDNYYLTLFDPAMGMVKIRHEYFRRAWTGYTLILEVTDTQSTEKEVIGDMHAKH